MSDDETSPLPTVRNATGVAPLNVTVHRSEEIAKSGRWPGARREPVREPAHGHRAVGDLATELVREDARDRPPREFIFGPTLLRALSREDRERLGIIPERAVHAPILLLRPLLERHDDPAVLSRTFPIEAQRAAVLKPYFCEMISKTSFRYHDHQHMDGLVLRRAWQRLSPAAHTVFPAHLDAAIGALAERSPDGQIRFSGDLPLYATALMRGDSLFCTWLLDAESK